MFAFIFLLLLIAESVIADCLSNTTPWNSQCFSLYPNSTGFADAELTCKQSGGHLASIHDGFTNALLAQEGNKNFHGSTETDFWIGATNLMKPPTWNWTDGTTFDFTDWKKDEPQNTSGLNCAALSMTDGLWSAQDCFMLKPFVCNVPPSVVPTSTTSAATTSYPTSVNCSEGWTYFAKTHSCYGVSAGGFYHGWTASENNCQNLGAHLPSIHSFEEFQFILSYVFVSWNDVWTGVYSPDSGRTWKTSDGSASDFLKSANWCLGSPTYTAGERCVQIGQKGNIGCYWDEDCNSFDTPSICKKPIL